MKGGEPSSASKSVSMFRRILLTWRVWFIPRHQAQLLSTKRLPSACFSSFILMIRCQVNFELFGIAAPIKST